jgi:hypothetical protein
VENNINEITRINPKNIAQETYFWAMFSDQFYEHLFQHINNKELLYNTYIKKLKDPRLNGKAREALTFFYRIRRDELSDPRFWEKIKESYMISKAKLVSESLNELNTFIDSNNPEESNKNILIKEISNLEQIIWDNCNKEGNKKWEEYSEDILSSSNLYSEDYHDYNQYNSVEEFQATYWNELDEYELIDAIEYASSIIKDYKE